MLQRPGRPLRLQCAALGGRHQLQRRLRLHERPQDLRQVLGERGARYSPGDRRQVRGDAGYGAPEQNLPQAVHAGTLCRGRVAGSTEDAEEG